MPRRNTRLIIDAPARISHHVPSRRFPLSDDAGRLRQCTGAAAAFGGREVNGHIATADAQAAQADLASARVSLVAEGVREERFKSLPEGKRQLKPRITLDDVEQTAMAVTDHEAARQLSQAPTLLRQLSR
jgi:hypothetical protein